MPLGLPDPSQLAGAVTSYQDNILQPLLKTRKFKDLPGHQAVDIALTHKA